MVEERGEKDKGVKTSLQAVENKEENHTVKKSIIAVLFHPCGYLTCRWMPRFTERIANVSALVDAKKERK